MPSKRIAQPEGGESKLTGGWLRMKGEEIAGRERNSIQKKIKSRVPSGKNEPGGRREKEKERGEGQSEKLFKRWTHRFKVRRRKKRHGQSCPRIIFLEHNA